VRLEQLWNELGERVPFSLLCAYPASSMEPVEVADALESVRALHTRATGTDPSRVVADSARQRG
jgi:hypothetical protein